jgi:hypothetical protein
MLTIVTANTDRLLLTRAEIAAVVSETDGAKLDALNARVSALIVKACRVPSAGATPPTLRLEDVSDTYRLKSTQKELILSRRPVVTIASLVENSVTLTEGTDFECDTSAGLLYRLSSDCRICWPWGLIVATYNAGWQTVPQDLKELTCKLATMIAAETGRDPSLGSMEIPGVISESYRYGRPDDPLIPAEIMEGLQRGGYVNTFVG